MPLKVVRNDITKMNTEAIVNTANDHAIVGTGCDHAVYEAAGREELLAYRLKNIGFVPEGHAFITPGFNLPAKYIIHAVSPLYMGGDQGEEEKLRSCYQKSLELAKEKNIKSIAFPLISTGGFGYPKEEGMRIAIDEINAFLMENRMEVYLVVFDSKATTLGEKLYPDLEAYIDQNYVEVKREEEYGDYAPAEKLSARRTRFAEKRTKGVQAFGGEASMRSSTNALPLMPPHMPQAMPRPVEPTYLSTESALEECCEETVDFEDVDFDFEEQHESKLEERMRHLSDTFSQYLMYLIQSKNMENAEVWKRAIIDKKIFSKIKNNPDYHPNKLTALCLCMGVKLNLDETKDLLARAGYALSPCDKTDIIFSYFIENGIYDMIELDIQLEEHGLPCIIS